MAEGTKLPFASDYMHGALPEILETLLKTNMTAVSGYGSDIYSESARERIREACSCPDADVFFLSGGTQANSVCISSLLQAHQGVIAADTGHISLHEAGAIEYGGHKVMTLPSRDGRISPEEVLSFCERFYADENHDHMVMPGMVYISHPTEYGTLYTLGDLAELRVICDRYNMSLYVDGARLAYALACPENDITLPELARYCDVFYIGGTKCGALIGEAVVIPEPGTLPHFFTVIKQRGALLAKGRLAGIQFDTLFRDGLYEEAGRHALGAASRIRAALLDKGYELAVDSPTNQLFVILENDRMAELAGKVDFSFWEKSDDSHTVVRFATSWATSEEDVEALISLL